MQTIFNEHYGMIDIEYKCCNNITLEIIRIVDKEYPVIPNDW